MSHSWTHLLVFISIVAFSSPQALAQSAKSMRGKLEVIVGDDFKNKKHDMKYYIKDMVTQKRTELKSTDPKLRGLKSGAVIKVRGRMNGKNQLEQDAGADSLLVEQEASSVLGTAAGTAADMRRVLMVKVNFRDGAISCNSDFFGSHVFGESNSVNSLIQETSKGRVGLQSAGSPEVTIDASVNDTCAYSTWSSQANTELSALGITSSDYEHIVYNFPRNSNCSAAARGSLNGKNVWNFGYCWKDLVAHELGHNFGMHHAGSGSNEYSDKSDFMGYSAVGLRQVNGARMIEVGWIDASQHANGGVGNYDLAPLELDTAEAGGKLQVLKYQDAVETNKTYYLSYRQRIGYDSNLNSGYITGVAIHSSTTGGYKTNLIKTLADGGSYSDPNGTFTVTQLSHDINGVQISVTANCTYRQPTVTLSPTASTGSPGSTVNLSMSVKNNSSSVCGDGRFNINLTSAIGLTTSGHPSQINVASGASESFPVDVAVGSIADGSYKVRGIASVMEDASVSGSSEATIIVDSTAPTTPQNLQASDSRSGISLSWQASSDASAITYLIFRNGSQIGTASSLGYKDSNVSRGVSYTYTVKARDAGRLTSGSSNSVTITHNSTKGGGKKGGGGSDDGGGGGGTKGKGRNK